MQVNFDPFEPMDISVFNYTAEEPTVVTKSKKKKKLKNLPPEVVAPHMHKYWAKRYQLFSKYDEGIKLDQGNTFLFNLEGANK